MQDNTELYKQASKHIKEADYIIIGAGAGVSFVN